MIQVNNLSKQFYLKDFIVNALQDISFEVQTGEFIGLIGPSGSGKTTLINCLAGLIKPNNGEIFIDNTNITELNSAELRSFRLNNIGMVFQEHLLIDSITAVENVEIPLIFQGVSANESRNKAIALLREVSLEEKANNLPQELSGGQQQRVGLARAMINNPKIILADEPTGNIDSKSGHAIIELFRKIAKEHNTSIIMVSHNPAHIKSFDRVLKLDDGTIN